MCGWSNEFFYWDLSAWERIVEYETPTGCTSGAEARYSVAIKSNHRKSKTLEGKNKLFFYLPLFYWPQFAADVLPALLSLLFHPQSLFPYWLFRDNTTVCNMTSGYQSGNESTLIRRSHQVQQQTQTCLFYLEIGFNYGGVNTLMRVAISGCLALVVEARRSLQTTGANLWKTQRKSWRATFCRFTAGFYWTTRTALKRHSLSFDEIRLGSLFRAYHLCEGKNSRCGN